MSKLNKVLEVKGNKLVATPKKATPKKAIKKVVKKVIKKESIFGDIFGINTGKKPCIELRVATVVFQKYDGKPVKFNQLWADYQKLMIRVNTTGEIDVNQKGRLRRIIYRTIPSGLYKKTAQGIRFNLLANYSGVKLKKAKKFTYKDNGDVTPQQVYDNEYTFTFSKNVSRVMKRELTMKTNEDIKAFAKNFN